MHATGIFMNGASQAVWIPVEYRFTKPDVCITRIGSMVVIFSTLVTGNIREFGRVAGLTLENLVKPSG